MSRSNWLKTTAMTAALAGAVFASGAAWAENFKIGYAGGFTG